MVFKSRSPNFPDDRWMKTSIETSTRVLCCVRIRAQPNEATEHSSFALDLLPCGSELQTEELYLLCIAVVVYTLSSLNVPCLNLTVPERLLEDNLQTMGFATKQTTTEVTAPPRLPDNSSVDIEDPVPWEVPMPVPAPPKPAHPSILAPAMKFLADVKADGKYRPLLMKFLADVKAAGKYRPLLMLLQDFTERGLHPGLITSAKELFEDHPDLLVALNTILSGDYQSTVAE